MEVSTRKPYFIEEEEEEEAEVSSRCCYKGLKNTKKTNKSYYNHQYFVSSPRSVVVSRFDHSCFGQQLPHFLDSCFLCKKRLGDNLDIFMYRGDTPFCSEECRGKQIEKDEAKEKKQSLSSSVKAMRRNEKRSSSSTSPPTKSCDYGFHTGTVVAA